MYKNIHLREQGLEEALHGEERIGRQEKSKVSFEFGQGVELNRKRKNKTLILSVCQFGCDFSYQTMKL